MRDSQFMTAADKERVLRDWERFLKSGLKWDRFTPLLYHHLMQHCSFIAHYDRAGFYSTYFADGDGKAQFLSQFDPRNAGRHGNPPSAEYGDLFDWCAGDYEDVNRRMISVAATHIPMLLLEAEAEQRTSDLAKARALLARHGYEMKIA